MTKKGDQKFLRMKHNFFGKSWKIFSQALKYSEKRGTSEIMGKCIIGLGGWTSVTGDMGF